MPIPIMALDLFADLDTAPKFFFGDPITYEYIVCVNKDSICSSTFYSLLV